MRIAVIGANGQVGREVCLFLSVMGADVVPITRTPLGGAFLERCGLHCVYAAIANAKDAARALAGCDLVCDFSYPSTPLPAETRPILRTNIENALLGAPEGVPYVHISTISAFGMPHADSPMEDYRIAHSRYAANKRYAERLALSARAARPVYALRLGQVHGELQTVSLQFVEEASVETVPLPFPPDTPSYTVFCFSIAEALRNIAECKEEPGLYTLVSTPAWSWAEAYAYWGRRIGVEPSFSVRAPGSRASVAASLRSTARRIVAPVLNWGAEYRELFLSYGVVGSNAIQLRLQALLLRRRAAQQVSEMDRHRGRARKFWVGAVPGRRLTSLSDSRLSMSGPTEAVRRIIDSVSKGQPDMAAGNASVP